MMYGRMVFDGGKGLLVMGWRVGIEERGFMRSADHLFTVKFLVGQYVEKGSHYIQLA